MRNRFFLFLTNVLLALSATTAAVPVYSQTGGAKVSVTLTDSKTGEPVGFVTVSLTESGADKAYKYILSNSEGKAELTGVKKGTFKLKAEIMGYKTYEAEVKVLDRKPIDLGTVKMEEDVQTLDAASVSAVGNPIIVKKDTIEYNASSFKTSDNDMLVELLKKLPGVEVAADGSITANGETIKKITIDGKTFFLDDPQLATKNIPAKIVEKVKVVEKKSDQAQFTGIDDGEEETIIDLSIRPGMMNGWFGNVMGGGGHDVPEKGFYTDGNKWTDDGWRYQGAAMVGRFTTKSQLSVILNGNNTNNRGFNDMAGNMMQNMRGAGRGMGRGSGGWGSNNGITTSWMGGMNGAYTLLDGDMDLAGNYLYNGSNRYVTEESSKTTYMDDGSSLIYDNNGYNITNSQGHRFGIRLDHKFSENTSILFEPQFNFGSGNYREYSDFNTLKNPGDGGDSALTNNGFSENTGANKNWTASGFLLFRQRLGKPGRTISAHFRYNFSNNTLDGLNQSYTDNDGDRVGDEIVNQRISSNTDGTSLSGRVVYTEPLGSDFYMEANYSYSWNRSRSSKDTYDSFGENTLVDGGGHLIYNSEGETYNKDYSNNITNNYQNHSAGLNFMYQKEKFRAQLGAAVNPTITNNLTNGEKYDSKVVNWSPQASLNYEIGENTNIRFFYYGRSSQPSTSQLMPVPDNSDPLNVSFGNPYLTPYFTHNLRGMFGYTNKKTFTSVYGHFGGGLVQDGITNALWYDGNGAQYSLPLNGPGSGNADLRIMVNSPIAKSKFSVSSMTYFRYSESTSYVGRSGMGDEFNEKYYDSETGVMNYDQFHKDFFEHSAAGSAKLDMSDYFTDSKTQSLNFNHRLRVTFRNDFVELNLGGRTRMSKSWYTVASYNQNPTWSNQVDFSMNWTVPGGVNLIANADYNWYNGYTTPQKDEVILNAEISKLLFKNKFTLAAKAYDILNQAKNLSVTDESNYHQETRNNTLGRYVILSLTYRFGNFNGNGQRRGGHPGGPMGPPPRRS